MEHLLASALEAPWGRCSRSVSTAGFRGGATVLHPPGLQPESLSQGLASSHSPSAPCPAPHLTSHGDQSSSLAGHRFPLSSPVYYPHRKGFEKCKPDLATPNPENHAMVIEMFAVKFMLLCAPWEPRPVRPAPFPTHVHSSGHRGHSFLLFW